MMADKMCGPALSFSSMLISSSAEYVL